MKKALSFILCILPFILFFATCIPALYFSIVEEMGIITETEKGFAIFVFLIAILAVIVIYGVMIWLIVKTIKNKDFTTAKKVVWCICLYYLNIFVFPVYWFMYIRME